MARWLAIVLPGAGYRPLGAALRLPALALEAAGAEVTVVEYPQHADRQYDRWWGNFDDAVSDQVGAAISSTRPERVTFVAKSLGTVALAALRPKGAGEVTLEAIWLTPLFGREAVRSGAIEKGWRSLLVAGGADSCHEPVHHKAVRVALNAWSVVMESADHSLEVGGDALATADRYRQLAGATVSFLH